MITGVDELFKLVGLEPALKTRYAHEFSEGRDNVLGLPELWPVNRKSLFVMNRYPR